jgi:hypothetical protein
MSVANDPLGWLVGVLLVVVFSWLIWLAVTATPDPRPCLRSHTEWIPGKYNLRLTICDERVAE